MLGHLRDMDIDVRVVQTDNGGEFIGGWQSRWQSVFTRVVEEGFGSLGDFLCKAYTYNLCFNYLRKNSYKGSRTPWEIVVECLGEVDKKLLSLPP